MSKVLFKSLLLSPAVLGAALAVSSAAIAADTNAAAEISQPQVSTLQPQSLASVPEAPQTEAAPVFSSASELSVDALKPAAPAQIASAATEQPAVAQEAPKVAQAAPAETDTSSMDQINRYSREGRSTNVIGQATSQSGPVTSVSQLSDVRPTDWAFQALQSLVERYGCIAGYPDRTYRGNRAMTRYEFAAGLNACLDRVNELIAAGTADLVKKEDLEALRKLQDEFAAELATLRGRVDALEARTATLEKQQFSTTTKLAGEVIFQVSDEFGQPVDNETVFQDRVRLALNTSFTGKDLLVTRLATSNAVAFTQQGAGGTQAIQLAPNTTNTVAVDWLAYYFPLGENIQFYVPAFGGLHYDYAPTSAGLMEGYDGGNGPLSLFAQRNPIYDIGGGAGIGVNIGLGKAPIKISLGYLADNDNTGANIPTPGAGLFNGNYSALAQVTFQPSDALSVSATYVNAYRQNGIFNFGAGASLVGTQSFAVPAEVNAFGASAALKLGNSLSLNAFFSYIDSDFFAGDDEIWTYGAGIAFADFGKKGNLLGFMAGVEPYVGGVDEEPIHLEGFYKYQLTDNISITPGVIWVINPGGVDNNQDVIIGTLRTTFTF